MIFCIPRLKSGSKTFDHATTTSTAPGTRVFLANLIVGLEDGFKMNYSSTYYRPRVLGARDVCLLKHVPVCFEFSVREIMQCLLSFLLQNVASVVESETRNVIATVKTASDKKLTRITPSWRILP